MKYRVTRRGWIVFSILALIILYGLFSLIDYTNPKTDNGLSEDKPPVVNPSDPVEETPDSSNDHETSDDAPKETEEDQTETDHPATGFEEDTDDNLDESPSEVDEQESDEEDQTTPETTIPMDQRDVLYFDSNSFIFKEEHQAQLDQWIIWLLSDPSSRVVIEGHYNGYPSFENTEYGLLISGKRSEAVKSYLIDQGIEEDRMRLENIGTLEPATRSDDFDEHYQNRRVIIYFDQSSKEE